MRQLFAKFPFERLKNLHWEKADTPVGRFCYFIGSSNTKPTYFEEDISVMDIKGRRRLSTKTGGICECYFTETDGIEKAFENLRKFIGSIVADAEVTKTSEIEIFWDISADALGNKHIETLLNVFGETLELSCYSMQKQKDQQELTVHLRLPSAFTNAFSNNVIGTQLEEGIRRGQALNFARYLGDLPANALTPQTLASHAEDRLSNAGQITIIADKELSSQGFGGILAVAQGSKNKPRLVVFDNDVQNPQKTVVLIGKGITFDTGGYSIKGKQHHNEMKFDMCGAANTIAALEILAPLLTNVRLVGILPLAENMVSADAQRPGDVYVAHNGKTVEVYNTDAEGRLILADALSYASTFKPDLIIDIATLTGGTTQIAGNLAGIMCTNDELILPLVRGAARSAGEKFIHLEIIEEAVEDLKSDVADYTNMHNKWSSGAPTMYAAAFLKEFLPQDSLWLHLDIANMAWSGRSSPYLRGRGATAFGARTLVNVVKAFCG